VARRFSAAKAARHPAPTLPELSIREANMFVSDEDDTRTYRVVVNHEEQYSIWPTDRDTPAGWRDAGKSGSRTECLAHIKDVWTDMRPLSVRESLKRAAQHV
jgi:MbtH protein